MELLVDHKLWSKPAEIERSLPQLLIPFVAGLGGILYVAHRISRHYQISFTDRRIYMWFVLCASLHLGFESYLVLSHLSSDEAHSPLLHGHSIPAELWREYAKSDQRYVNADGFVLAAESLTVFIWGPLSLLTAYMILEDHPIRHVLQLMVSVAHIYGCMLYYLSAALEEHHRQMHQVSIARPLTWRYYIYYIGFNLPWIIVPAMLIVSSAGEIWAAFEERDMRPIPAIQVSPAETAQLIPEPSPDIVEELKFQKQLETQSKAEQRKAKRASAMIKKMA